LVTNCGWDFHEDWKGDVLGHGNPIILPTVEQTFDRSTDQISL
jgi:hypothetical protein